MLLLFWYTDNCISLIGFFRNPMQSGIFSENSLLQELFALQANWLDSFTIKDKM